MRDNTKEEQLNSETSVLQVDDDCVQAYPQFNSYFKVYVYHKVLYEVAKLLEGGNLNKE